MGGKKTVDTPEGPIEGTIVNVNSSSEHWNQYLLEDGTMLKLKCVLTEAFKADGKFDADKNPLYMVRTQNVLTVISPDELKKKD